MQRAASARVIARKWLRRLSGSSVAALTALVIAGCARDAVTERPGVEEPALTACVGLSCGSACSFCERGELDCINAAVEATCNWEGVCTSLPSRCERRELDDVNVIVSSDEPGELEPGQRSSEGRQDEIAESRGDVETSVQPDIDDTAAAERRTDDPGGRIRVPEHELCKGDDCPDPPEPIGYVPCEGKQCGDRCMLCPPGAEDCYEPPGEKVCSTAGRCAQTPVPCQ